MNLKSIISSAIKFVAAAVLMITCFLFLFSTKGDGNILIFKMAGDYALDSDFKEALTDDYTALSNIQSTTPLEVKYGNTICLVGKKYNMKSLVLVKTSSSSDFVSGNAEDGFEVYFTDFRDEVGNSISVTAMDNWDMSEEMNELLYYDEDTEEILFNSKGIYLVDVMVCDENGKQTMVELKIPVEG